jgi:hypothetical protein
MSYFMPGLWHFASAMAFAVALGVLDGGEPTLWLRRVEFTIPLLVASSALFFIPDGLGQKGDDEVSSLSPARLGCAAAGAGLAPPLAARTRRFFP